MTDRNDKSQAAPLIAVFIIALACSVIMYVADRLTRAQVETNRQADTVEMIEAVMPLNHDNDLYSDSKQLEELSTIVYRARLNETNIGLVFMPVNTSGYKNPIKIAVGVSFEGVISGVRIIEQQETVGLGDGIHQDNTDWISNFNNRSLDNTPAVAWAVRSDGGEFDQLSGATISPRSVINAVKNTLDFYQLKRDSLYELRQLNLEYINIQYD